MAIPNFQAAGDIAYQYTTGTISLTVVLPSHQADDILFLSIYVNSGYDLIVDGWTKVDEFTISGVRKVAWFWKRAESSSETNPVVTGTIYEGYTYIWGIAYVVRGCIKTGTPIEDATGRTDGGGSPENVYSSTITTTEDDRLVACPTIIDDNNAWNISPPPTGWTLNDDKSTALGTDCRFTFISKEKPLAGDEPSVIVGRIDYINWGTLTLAFIPLAGAIEKTFEESGSGAEVSLVNKILTIADSGSGIDKWVLPEVTFISFSDSGNGVENLLVNKVLLPFKDSGSGVESWIANKLREFADSGVGVDVFLRDWTPIFTDLGSGVEAYYKVFHYPANLKRVIILIRDRK